MEIGKLPESVLKRSVFKQLKTKRKEVLSGAAVGEDCAIFRTSSQTDVATCMQEAVIRVEREESFGTQVAVTLEHLILRALNNLWAEGADPFSLLLNLMLPEGFEEPDLKKLMAMAEATCGKYSLQIAGGQSFVTSSVTEPIGVVTVYGMIPKDGAHNAKSLKADQDIVVTKWVGLEGTAVLAKEKKNDLKTRYPMYLIEDAMLFDTLLSVEEEAKVAAAYGVGGMHDCSKGGIFAALWELAEGGNVGLDVDLKKIPLRQETVEVCEFCGGNPYELLGGGSLVITADDGEGLAEYLQEKGIPATVVGKTTGGKDRILRNEDETRFMDRPRKDEIFRLLKSEI